MDTSSRWQKRVLGWVSLVVLAGSSSVVYADVFNTARTLKPAAFSLGIEGQLDLYRQVPTLNLYAGAGVVQGFDLGLRFGLPINRPGERYLGLDAEIQLLAEHEVVPSLSWGVGAHLTDWSRYGLDSTLLVSKVYRRFEPFLGLDFNYELPLGSRQWDNRILGGLDIHLSRYVEFLLELGFGLGRQHAYGSAGFNVYL